MAARPPPIKVTSTGAPDPGLAVVAVLPLFLGFLEGRAARRTKGNPPQLYIAPARASDEESSRLPPQL